MVSHLFERPGAGAVALAYDELPEGSELRREFDGRGGLQITAPAGEPPESMRRYVGHAGLLPASVAFGVCVAVGGPLVLEQILTNRIDPELRSAALLALGVLATGVFLFVWLTRRAALSHAVAEARRRSSVLHADAERLLVEVAAPSGDDSPGESLDLPVAQLWGLKVAVAALDPARESTAVPCLRLFLTDGTTHLLLGGHHPMELAWVAGSVSEVTGVSVVQGREPRAIGTNRAGGSGCDL